jgi:DNA-directed RNA polymerase subunit M/transcription elongation factor TFIIS
MELREKSIQILNNIIDSEKNSKTFEEYIYNFSNRDEEVYKNYLYDVCGLLLKYPQETKKIAKDVKFGNFMWKSFIYKNISEKIQEYDDYIVNPFEVVEGVTECPKCRGLKTWSVQKQTRSSDEPMTTFSMCVDCKFRWTYSG